MRLAIDPPFKQYPIPDQDSSFSIQNLRNDIMTAQKNFEAVDPGFDNVTDLPSETTLKPPQDQFDAPEPDIDPLPDDSVLNKSLTKSLLLDLDSIKAAISSSEKMRFTEILGKEKNRHMVAKSFSNLLTLASANEVSLLQKRPFDDIFVQAC